MRIVEVARREGEGRVRLVAQAVWERAARPPDALWVETPEAHSAGLRVRGETFVLGTLVAAMERAEERIAVEAPLCPTFLRALPSALRSLRHWHPHLSEPRIEPLGGLDAPSPVTPGAAATTFSGGVDSLAAIAANRHDVPRDHPARVRAAFFVHGMNTHEIANGRADEERLRAYERRLERWRPLAAQAEVDLVPVSFGFRSIAVSFESWARRSLGAALAGAAHAFSGRISRFLVPSSGATDPRVLDGAHPLLDPFFGNAALTVVGDGVHRSRLEKLEVLARWPEALAAIEPCQQHRLPEGGGNCGECNKCHRTMVALEAVGLLAQATSLPRRAVDAAFVERIRVVNFFDVENLEQAADAFRARGRRDLEAAARRRLRRWHWSRRMRALRRAVRLGRRRRVPA